MTRKLLLALTMTCVSFCVLSAKKVFMLGDSHVYGKIYPATTQSILKEAHPDMEFSFWGKNGAEFSWFNSKPEYLEELYAFRPDVLIVHLGTNDSYGRYFNSDYFLKEMDKFCSGIIEELPGCKIVFVTPFTNKQRASRKKGRWNINGKTRQCSDDICRYADEHDDMWAVDNNAEAGMIFYEQPGLIRHDNVHLTEKGYTLLGQQVANSILEIEELWSESD